MQPSLPFVLLCDTREPWPHPWEQWLPSEIHLERATLDVGDFCLAGLEGASVIERKTVGDLLSCIGRERERFERELARSRHLGAFAVVVEGSLGDCIRQSRGLHPSAIVGTVAAWTRRYCPVVFCDSERLAADFAFRFLTGQVRDGWRIVETVRKAASRLEDSIAKGVEADLVGMGQ